MHPNKIQCFERNDNIQKGRDIDKKSPVEQALSNAVIVGNILEFLSPQDIIQASLVNKDWCAYSRECLRQKSNNYPVCAQVRQNNPCRALADFDNFLLTITGGADNNQDTIIFNGIHQSYWNCDLETHTDCLMNDWKHGDDPLSPEELTAKIQETYGRVLEKIQFRFIHSLNEIPVTCPFAMLIKFVISERAEEILELDFGSRSDVFKYKDVKYYLLDQDKEPRLLPNDFFEYKEPKVFPNLKVFGVKMYENNIPIQAPVLKTLKHFQFKYNKCSTQFPFPIQSDFHFPLNAITSVKNHMNLDAIKNLVNFIQVFRPSLQYLAFHSEWIDKRPEHTEGNPNIEYNQAFFTLGQLTSHTLTHLHCTPSAFAFMAGKGFFSCGDDELEFINVFPSLKDLSLTGWMEVDLVDWFSCLKFSKNFPKLQRVELALKPPSASCVRGPYNCVQECFWTPVSTLVLKQTERYSQKEDLLFFEPRVTPIPRVLGLFAHIRHLDLSRMKLRCDQIDQTFADIINELENLPFLEELSICPTHLSLLCLDHIFLQNETLVELKQLLGEANLEHLLVYKSSVLHHKRLKRINIHATHSCLKRYGTQICYSDQPPGTFIISNYTAGLICMHRPGFQIHLKTDRCLRAHAWEENYAQCSKYVNDLGVHFEHLEPYIISTTKRKLDDVRVFEFFTKSIDGPGSTPPVELNTDKSSLMEYSLRNSLERPDNIQENRDMDKPSPVEQALSNGLIVENILEFLSPQDIIQASLVSTDWCAYSRKCLRKKSRKSPVCVQVTLDNPCRVLADFDNFLQTITGRGDNNQDTIIFNGIHQCPPDFDLKGHKNCLMKDWKRGKKRLSQKELTAKIKETYGRVLGKIKFRFINSLYEIPITCPLAMLIKFVVSQRAEEILELDFGTRCDTFSEYEDINYYLLDEDKEPRLLPNLEVFGTNMIAKRTKMPVLAPALKTLKHFRLEFESDSNNRNMIMPIQFDYEFPLNVITRVQTLTHLNAVDHLVNFIQQFRPSLQMLSFQLNPYDFRLEHTHLHQNVQQRRMFFTLGQLTSSTLTFLMCPLSTLAFMASTGFFPRVDDEFEFKNAFPSLKTIIVTGWMEVDLIDWFSWIDFPNNFPQLQTVNLTLIPPGSNSCVQGPYNYVHDCVCTAVSTLILDQSFRYGEDDGFIYFEPGITHIPRVLRLFANIRHLDLIAMKLRCDHTDQTFSSIINELENLPFLEELSIRPRYMCFLRLDHIFLQNEKLVELKQLLGEANLEHLSVYKSSLLNHKRLKRINIELKDICREHHDPPDHSRDTPTFGNFILSSHMARIICMYRPGFQIHLTTDHCNRRRCVGNSVLYFQHLEPYISSTTKGKYEDVRVFKFLDDRNDGPD